MLGRDWARCSCRLLEVEEDRRSKLKVLRVVRVPTTSTWIVTSARRLRVENGVQICKTCEQGAAQRKRGQKERRAPGTTVQCLEAACELSSV